METLKTRFREVIMAWKAGDTEQLATLINGGLCMYPELRDDEAGQVIEAVRDFCRRETRALAGLSTPGLTRLP